VTTKYEKAVAEARRLVSRSEEDQWRLAELTWQQVEGGTSRNQWAKDVGVSKRTVARWYNVWVRFGSAPARPSYSEAFQAVDKDLAVEDVYAERHQMEAQRTVRNMPPERKAAIVSEAIEADPVVAAAASLALDKRNAELPKPRARERTKSDRYSDALTAMRAADVALDRFTNAVSGAEWSAVEADSFETILARWSGAIDLIRAGLRSGTWDDELAKLTGSL
jgi:transposase